MSDAPEPVDMELVARLRVTAMRLARRIRRESGDDITPSQLTVLGTIERFGPLPLGTIAELEAVQPPTVTRIVGLLQDEGMVRLAADDADRRVKVASITTKGRTRLDRIRSNRNAWLAYRLDALSQADRDALEAALPALEHLLGDRQ